MIASYWIMVLICRIENYLVVDTHPELRHRLFISHLTTENDICYEIRHMFLLSFCHINSPRGIKIAQINCNLLVKLLRFHGNYYG